MNKFLSLALNATLIVSGNYKIASVFNSEDISLPDILPTKLPGISAPGTRWCGPGNTATNYYDLGMQRETDMCCREHDHCAEIMEPRSSLNGLNNDEFLFPILKCSCEQEFISCLKSVNNLVSNSLGRLYYAKRKRCFAQGHPIQDCKEYQENGHRKRCVRYNVDQQQPQRWQFYDMPFYCTKRPK